MENEYNNDASRIQDSLTNIPRWTDIPISRSNSANANCMSPVLKSLDTKNNASKYVSGKKESLNAKGIYRVEYGLGLMPQVGYRKVTSPRSVGQN
eukprot:CAMPEP_0184697740 /NCGR_PEP_ID=MMETSP0313-20130426/4606_1 /TAXON_ID=2792 /ORGANISM="Porphyridium aerugineum, Strain SAG 1380-2" /LENGTH=94 /DNA_ID=CAMNT_0027156575 /DNA_START=244 /DNA_END=528 /DNA_ORIENTATION=+